ncbi:MAG: hypothetical protein U9R25_10840 [Chloroflexota bacterium]|nr:hypothetical protein [Chloroflexota bacterium]
MSIGNRVFGRAFARGSADKNPVSMQNEMEIEGRMIMCARNEQPANLIHRVTDGHTKEGNEHE